MKKQLLNEINHDLETGVYDAFPILKKRIEFIANKIAMAIYVTNCELSEGEKRILKESGYEIT